MSGQAIKKGSGKNQTDPLPAIAIATNGEVGSSTLPKAKIAGIRRAEAEASAAVIGAEFNWLGYPDEFLFDDADSRLRFIDMVRQVRYGVPAVAMMENFSRMRGFQCGCQFAEGFRSPPLWPRTVDPNGLL